MGWPTARACRSGEESQQPTCPQVRYGRKCTHSVPSRRHSSHPFGVCGYTCRIMLRWGSLTVDVGVLAVSLPLRMSSMLAGGRGPHIIRPASSVLGRGTGLAGRGMSAGPESGRLGRSPCPDSPTARSSRSVPPRGWSRRAHRDADPGPAPNSVDRGDHRPAVRDRRLRPPGPAAAARCRPAHPGTAHRVARRAGQLVPDAAQRSAPGRGRGPAPSAAALASRIECTCP